MCHAHRLETITSDKLWFQKGAREWVRFKGTITYCRFRDCDHEKFLGIAIPVERQMVDTPSDFKGAKQTKWND